MNQKLKKLFAIILTIVSLLTLSACGGSEIETDGSGTHVDEFFVKVATGQQGGTYYPIGVAMAQVFTDKVSGCVSSGMATGGSVDNIGLLQDGEAQVAMIMSTTCKDAYNGTGPFEGAAYDELRSICALWENNIQFIVPNKITNISQLKGTKFVVGANASGTELDARTVLGAFGLYYTDADASKNNIDPVYLDYAQGVDALKDGQVSGVVNVSHAPASSVTDLLSTGDYHILEFSSEELEAIKATNEIYDVYTIPAGTYPNQNAEIKAIGYPVLLTCPASADADQIYSLTKAIFDNSETLVAAHSAASSITIENAVKGLVVPLHEGAERFFSENGAI